MLPDMSGFDLLEGWRKEERFDETAMVMFTNLSDSVQRKQASELGADGYYVKADVDINDLPHIIEKHIDKKRKKGWFPI